jgi:FMN-dependent NADH-azoreductase
MAHLLHVDSSIRGDASVSRKLSARAADVWRAAHPGGTVTYRDLGRDPLPHLDAAGGLAASLPPDQHTSAQAESWAMTELLVGEVKEADTIVLGLPLYNFGAPSSVKAWTDRLLAPGLSIDPETHAGLLGGRDFVVLASRGAATARARHAKAGTTPRRGYRTPWRQRAWSRASSPPSSHSQRQTRPWPS